MNYARFSGTTYHSFESPVSYDQLEKRVSAILAITIRGETTTPDRSPIAAIAIAGIEKILSRKLQSLARVLITMPDF